MKLCSKTICARRSRKPYGSSFRKACRPCFSTHSPGVQWHRQCSRTCFEGPFGEVVRQTGAMANANPFRFSTKYQDDETDLVYYGHRYEKDGRWLSRDPLNEAGGVNLYAVNRNDCVGRVDSYGLSSCNISSWFIAGKWLTDGNLGRAKVQLGFAFTAVITWTCTDCEKSCCQPERWIKLKEVTVVGKPEGAVPGGTPADGRWHPEDPQNISKDHCVYRMVDAPGWEKGLNSGDKVKLTGTYRLRVRDKCNKLKTVFDQSFDFSVDGTYPNSLNFKPSGLMLHESSTGVWKQISEAGL